MSSSAPYCHPGLATAAVQMENCVAAAALREKEAAALLAQKKADAEQAAEDEIKKAAAKKAVEAVKLELVAAQQKAISKSQSKLWKSKRNKRLTN